MNAHPMAATNKEHERRKRTGLRRDIMKYAGSIKALVLLLATAALSACGGGGGSGNDSPFNPPGIQVTATAGNGSIGINSSTDVTVRVTQVNGTPVANGTAVTASVSPAGIGNIAAVTGGNSTGTQGGNASFRFQSAGQQGTAVLSFSVQDPNVAGRTVTSNLNVTITGSTTGDSRLTIAPVRTSLPVNIYNVPPFVGSPYLTEVVITARTASGQPINEEDGIQVSVNPVGSTGGFSTLDDAETEDENEFEIRLGQGPVDVVAGRATIFVHSLNFSGATTLTVTMADPETQQTVIATQTFNITTVTPPLPSEIILATQGRPVYVQGSGGNTSVQLEARVNDGIGQPVPDPVAGNNAFNNVRLEILNQGQGERLSGINAQGQSVSGGTISIRTTNGIGGALFTSGTRTGTTVVRATSDRADNNVDNGISDPVVTERSIVVSDGRLFNIELTQPIEDALVINPVDPTVGPSPGTSPESPDGTYSITVSIIATDRLGNPVVPGTPIKFGLIDEPQDTGGFDFLISGVDGNPQEGGTLFTAAGGQFRTAGGGAGPGDAIAIFGKEVPGNRDLEGARRITSVNSQTSLTVERRFNLNDDTGVTVDYLGALPYVIGRAQDGNIVAEGVTNEFGVARTVMTYPTSRLGKRVVVWAQGDGDIINGVPETVSDVDVLAFAGIAPIEIFASPSTIAANTTADVSVCVIDALGTPLRGVTISFNFGAFEGTGTVDGTPNNGVLGSPTGPDGCSIATVVTSGVSDAGGEVVFSVGGAEATVTIVRGDLILQASPTFITEFEEIVTLTLINGSGAPQAGYLILGTCTGENGTVIQLFDGPGTTNANGQTTVRVSSSNLNQIGQAGGGSCEFSTTDGSATATVTIQGRDICDTEFSPPPAGCGDPPPTVTLTLNIFSSGPGAPGFSVVSNPAGITCTVAADGASESCVAEFEEGTDVTLVTSPSVSVTWLGECVPAGGNPSIGASVEMGGDRVCTATSDP
jgi:hypothetical protein